jgi:predicted phage-related endonuclease
MINEQQRAERKFFIGSSDAPIIAGAVPTRNGFPTKTIMDLYAEKAGLLKPQPEKKNAAAEVGNYLERGILDWFEATEGQRLGITLSRNRQIVAPDGFRAANLDADFVTSTGDAAIVEAKSTGLFLFGNVDREEWGEFETDQVPDRVTVQCQHQMDVARESLGLRVQQAYVPTLLLGIGLGYYVIPYNEDLGAELKELEEEFWDSVQKRRPPDADILPNLDTIKRLTRVEGKRKRIDFTKVLDWHKAKEAKASAEQLEEEAKKAMLAELEDAEIGEAWVLNTNGEDWTLVGELTYREQTKSASFVAESTFRVARWKDLTKKEAASKGRKKK